MTSWDKHVKKNIENQNEKVRYRAAIWLIAVFHWLKKKKLISRNSLLVQTNDLETPTCVQIIKKLIKENDCYFSLQLNKKNASF